MKLQALVGAVSILLTTVAPGASADLNARTGTIDEIGIKRLSAEINLVAADRFRETAVSSVVDEQLKLLWEHFSDYPEVKQEVASSIRSVWMREAETSDNSARTLLAQDVLGRVWQTYHCLIANRQPLSDEETNRKTEQVRRLAAALDELDDELLKGVDALPLECVDSVRAEMGRSIARLKEHAASPAYPLLYRPLSDSDFEKVMVAIRADHQDRIHRFLQDLPATAAWVEKRRAGKDKASRQFLAKTGWEEKGTTFAALAMGSVVRHYCMLGRNVDYSDPIIFPPFLKVNGAGVAYRMSDGLSMRLSIDENN